MTTNGNSLCNLLERDPHMLMFGPSFDTWESQRTPTSPHPHSL
jgi:hypothetical protein